VKVGEEMPKTIETVDTSEAPPVVAPAPPVGPPLLAPNWFEEGKSYLTAHGWEMVSFNGTGGSRWADPRGKGSVRAEMRPAVELPTVGGGKEVVHQFHAPPVSWDLSMEEAVLVQRQRDLEEGQRDPTPLEQLATLGKKYDVLHLTHSQLCEVVRNLAQKPLSDRPENARWIQARLADALAACRLPGMEGEEEAA
jgi:hypothetical protein